MEEGRMKTLHMSNRTLIHLVLVTLTLLLAAACSSQENPFDIGERATSRSFTPTALPAAPAQAQPTATSSGSGSSEQTSAPTPTPAQESGSSGQAAPAPSPTPVATLEPTAVVATVEARQVEHLKSLFEPSLGAIKLAEWDHKPVQFENALLGYIIVYGYDFTVELVPTEGDAYQDAFQKGELDIVLELDKDAAGDWYKTHIDGQGIIDLGSVRDGDGNLRLIGHSGLSEKAPDVAEFLAKVKPTDALIEKLSSTIKGGRIGIKPMVPAIKFLKEQEAIWTTWVPAPVAEKVKAAIAAKKASLVNRKCIPDGGSGGGSPNCGT